ncbi:MAG TPA: ABC transporter [Anaerolinea thermolimosa]|uniref:ABC transporter n=1 Tax=Anaerolinea thermolimosa TaxID=229919 RepID=A0A3D1JGN2_9CHLR|nr:ATP-binding cassette domain-containing protein [Anaerolinea thermolimosa]GAP08443.1 ABC-type Na+ transport system, ATPase component [Anaerolinea thermolimosa]HCE17385.1 ABC transporter [Anaerolinea thermolimosa]
MISVQHVKKSFGKVQAVKDISFMAHDGQITGILGPNGAGKTTTLRMIYTVLRPDAGSVTVDGFDAVRQSQEVRQRIGALTDSHGIYPRLTARENIRYFGRLHGLEGRALEERIEALTALLDMQDFIDRRAEGFSSGQRVKVCIARALAHNPQNVLLDEPTNGLDVMSTRSMREFIRRLREEGKCVLFSSHIMQEVTALCDQIVIIANGLVTASGTPDEIRQVTGKENLEDAFVAAIGSEEGLIK